MAGKEIVITPFLERSSKEVSDSHRLIKERQELAGRLYEGFEMTIGKFGVETAEHFRIGENTNVIRQKRSTPPVNCVSQSGEPLMDIVLEEVLISSGSVVGYQLKYKSSNDNNQIGHSAGIYIREETRKGLFEVFNGIQIDMPSSKIKYAIGVVDMVFGALEEQVEEQQLEPDEVIQ